MAQLEGSCALCLVVLLAGDAAAERRQTAAVRVSGAVGSFGELTWAAPGVDLVGTHEFCRRWSISAAIGYAPIDNHTYLADGRIVRAAAMGRLTEGRWSGALAIDVEHVAYYADPDVLEKVPDVNLIARRGGFTPTLGIEGAYRVTPGLAVGVFARVSMVQLELFENPAGANDKARFVFGGIFVDLRIR